MRKNTQSGFTLVELLVVIFIIGTLAALLLTNFVGARDRALDARKKADDTQLKNALRLYYNDYNNYPNGAGTLLGCGANTPPTGTCTAGSTFSGGSNGTVYMKQLPSSFKYYSDGSDKFLIITTLTNKSDPDITASQTRCDPNSKAFFTDAPVATDQFVVCED